MTPEKRQRFVYQSIQSGSVLKFNRAVDPVPVDIRNDLTSFFRCIDYAEKGHVFG